MAHKTMQLTEAGVQQYRTRMLVGDPITLSATDARRLARIGWVEEPKRRPRQTEAAERAIIPTVEEVLAAEVVEEPKAPAPKKRAPRKVPAMTTGRKGRK